MTERGEVIRDAVQGRAGFDAFQWSADPDESFGWMICFIDRSLRG